MSTTTAAELIDVPTPDIIQLHHNCLLELLRRHPPTWPTSPVYHMAARIFATTRELHAALSELDHQEPTAP